MPRNPLVRAGSYKMLKCRDITRLTSEELDRELSLREKMALKVHLMMCRGCQNFRPRQSISGSSSKSMGEERDLAAAMRSQMVTIGR